VVSVDEEHNCSTEGPVGTAKSESQLEQQEEKPTKSSKSAPVGSVWTQANAKFQFGQPMLPAIELEKAGPGCVALHAHYIKACEEQRKGGIVAMIKHQHFWLDSESEPFVVGLVDLFDLSTLDGLDISLLRCFTL
jgi:Cu/Zn superoxide dismutase